MTAPRPDIPLPIDVRGAVRFDGPAGSRVTLEGNGSALRLALPGWADAARIGPASLLATRRALVNALRLLDRACLTLAVEVDGQRALVLGAGVKPTLLARLLGMASADIRVATVARFLWSRATAH